MNNIIGKQSNTHLHKLVPVTLSSGRVKTNDPANNEQADNVKLIPKPKQPSSKKKLGLAFLGALTIGSVAVGTLETAGITNLFPSHKEIEVIKERLKLKPFKPEEKKLPMPEEDEAAKLQRKLKEDINIEIKRIQELEGIIPEDKVLSEEEEAKHIKEFGSSNYFSMSQDKVKEMLQLRAEYNITKNANLFNKYLLYRNATRNNPEKLALYDTLVKKIQDNTGVVFAKENFPNSYLTSPHLDNCEKGDPSSCYMWAAGLAELMHNRPDIINKILDRHEKFQLILFQKTSPKSERAGYGKCNSNLLINNHFWSGFICDDDGYNLGLHEYFHTIDWNILPNGMLPEMTGTQKKEFKNIRRDLFDKVEKGTLKHNYNNSHFAYAFANGIEFLPTTIETFYETPKMLYEISPDLYNIYRDYFKLDPLNGYIDVVETMQEPKKAELSTPKEEPAKPKEITRQDINNELMRLQVAEISKSSNVLNSREIELVYNIRARYNLTKDANVFNEYLPYRNSIVNDSDKLAKYESLVYLIQERTKMSFCSDVGVRDVFNGVYSSNPLSLDPSNKYIYASLIVELLHNREDLINKIIPPIEHEAKSYNFEIMFCPNADNDLGGLYTNDYNLCAVNNECFWSGLVNKKYQYNSIIHELGHAIDYAPLLRDPSDGIFAKMSPESKEKFLCWRQTYFNTYNANDKNFDPVKNANDITSTGLRAYAFKGENDFLAVSLEVFYKQPEVLHNACPELYDLYRDYFKFDPLNSYKDVIVQEPVHSKDNGNLLKIDDTEGIFQ